MSKTVLVPIADGTEELEAIAIIDVLRRAGAEVHHCFGWRNRHHRIKGNQNHRRQADFPMHGPGLRSHSASRRHAGVGEVKGLRVPCPDVKRTERQKWILCRHLCRSCSGFGPPWPFEQSGRHLSPGIFTRN